MGCLVLSVGVELELLQLLVLRLLDDNTYLIVVVKLEMRINLLSPQHVLLPDEEVSRGKIEGRVLNVCIR